MARFTYLEKELANLSEHKLVQKACNNRDVVIMYWARDSAWHLEKKPDNERIVELIRKDMQEWFPDLHEV